MFFDYNRPSILGDFNLFPDFPFVGEPRVLIEENPTIGGTSTGTSLAILGDVGEQN